MLINIPAAVNSAARNVIINHPNTFEAQVFRKRVTRTDAAGAGGLPTLGGLGVLDSEDETEVVYDHLGNGFAFPVDAFSPSSMMGQHDANNGSGAEFRYLVEPFEPSGMPGWFDLRKHDVLYIVLHDLVKLAYEVVDIETTLNIPPYSMRYVTNRRGDMDVLP